MLNRLSIALCTFAVFCLSVLFSSEPAAAFAYPCNGPGPGRIMVGVSPGGNGVASVPMCEDDPNSASQQGSAPVAASADYSAVAWHEDASDIWASARYQNRATADNMALRHCTEVMGSGCQVIWQVNGYIGVALGATGNIHWAADGSKGKVKKMLDEQCKGYVLGCLPIGIFKSTDTYESDGQWVNIRKPKNATLLRKKYGAVAWLDGPGYDGTSFVATGHATYPEAVDAAMAACRKHNGADAKCEVSMGTGNGFLYSYRNEKGDSYTAEQTEKRAEQVMSLSCKKDKLTCTVSKVFDVRQPGLFAHRMQ